MAKRDLRSLTPVDSADDVARSNILFGAPGTLADEPATYELGALQDFINADRVKAPTESTAFAIPYFVGTTGGEIGASNAHVDAAGNITSPGAIAAQTRKLDVHDDIKLQASVPDAPAAGYVRLFAREVGGVTRIGIIDENEAVTELTGLLGDVFGPGAAVTDGRAVLWDGTSGKLIKQASAAPSLVGHTHDDRYYTESEIDALIASVVANYASTASGKGASLVGVQDSGSYFTGTTVEAVLAYLGERIAFLDAAVVLQGDWDASSGVFPGGGTAQRGMSYFVTVAGTVNGVAFAVNDRIIAKVDNASTTTFAGNWFKADYTDQVLSVAGKTGAVTLQVADITDMSANGRSLTQSANYASMRGLLDLEAGTDFYSKSAMDALIVPIVSGGRLGTIAKSVPSSDWDLAVENGWYMVSSGTNAPGGSANWFIGLVTSHNSLWTRQQVWDFANTNTEWTRVKNNGTWGAWIQQSGSSFSKYFPGGTDVAVADGGTGASDAATARTNLGLAIGTNVQAYSANLATFAGVAPSANAQSLLGAANYAAMRALLDLEAGTDFYSVAAANAAFAAIGRSVSAGDGMTGGGTLAADRTLSMSANSRTGTITVTIGDGQNALTTGVKGFLPIDFNGVITSWAVIGDASGSVVVDVWKNAAAVPANGNSIVASAKPTLSSAQYAASSTLTGWTTSFAAGDVFGFEIESATTVKQVTLSLKFVKP
jgi:hypothetical protein